MSVWATKEVMRCALRFCSCRSLWQQRSFLPTTAMKDTSLPCQHLLRICGPEQSQTWLPRRAVSSVRFYSQGRNDSDELNRSTELSEPPEVQFDEMASVQRQRSFLFMKHLRDCASPSDVLDLTCEHSPTVPQVKSALNNMWFTTKKMSAEQRRCELQLMFDHPAFGKLLQKAMMSVKHMRNDDMTLSLLSMVRLGVPEDTRVIQTFLRACQEKVNGFDERNLSVLATSLQDMEGHNVAALKDGLKLIFEARLPKIETAMALQSMLRVLGKDVPKHLKQKIERKALSMTDIFTLPNTQYMIITMASVGFYSKPLLDVYSKRIIDNLPGVPFSMFRSLLMSFKSLLYRDLDLFTGISDHVASTLDIWTDKQVLLFLCLFEDLGFCPDVLMKAYAAKVIANPDALTLNDLTTVLNVYSSLNYDLQHQRQPFLASLSHALDSYLPRMPGHLLLKAVYCLSLLGHFPSAPLEQLLQTSVLEELESSKYLQKVRRMFQTVVLSLRLDRPPLPQPLTVPASVLGDPIPLNYPKANPWLSKGLQNVLGDQAHTMLQEMVLVESAYLIDGVITKSLPNQTVREADECSPAESSQRLAVICTPPSGVCYGTSNPRGQLAITIRHLKILGYTPVVVMEQELRSVSEERQMNILRESIFPEHHRSEAAF